MSFVLHYAPDNASAIIRLALQYCDFKHHTCLVSREAMADQSPQYLVLNPNGKIQTLETPDGPMFETAAISLWLDELAPKKGLLPRQGPLRAAALKWPIHLSSTAHPDLVCLFYAHRYCGQNNKPDFERRMRIKIAKSFMHIEHHMLAEIDILTQAPALGFYLGFLFRWAQLYPQEGLSDTATFFILCKTLDFLQKERWLQEALLEEGIAGDIFTSPKRPNCA